jgi:hypothetical protein
LGRSKGLKGSTILSHFVGKVEERITVIEREEKRRRELR